jgi:hypothetical protein
MARSKDIELADAHKNARDKEGHSIGWPHYDRRGNCLCYCWRCFGSAGCIDKHCAGHNHQNCAAGHPCSTETCSLSSPAGSSGQASIQAATAQGKSAEILAVSDSAWYTRNVVRKEA